MRFADFSSFSESRPTYCRPRRGYPSSTLQFLLGLGLGLLSLLLSSVGAYVELAGNPVPRLPETLSELSEHGLSRGRRAVFVEGVLLAGVGSELVGLGTLGDGLALELAGVRFSIHDVRQLTTP